MTHGSRFSYLIIIIITINSLGINIFGVPWLKLKIKDPIKKFKKKLKIKDIN